MSDFTLLQHECFDEPADPRLKPLVALRQLLPFAEGDDADRKLLRRLDIEQAVKR